MTSTLNGGIHCVEAEKQKPNIIELLSHMNVAIDDRRTSSGITSTRDLFERCCKEYNTFVKVQKYKITHELRNLMIALARCPKEVIAFTSAHYSKYRRQATTTRAKDWNIYV
jgi:hypothetical protein